MLSCDFKMKALPLAIVLLLGGCGSGGSDADNSGATNPNGSGSGESGSGAGAGGGDGGDAGTGDNGSAADTGLPDGGESVGAADTSAGISFSHAGWVFEESDMQVVIPVNRNDDGVGAVSVAYSTFYESTSTSDMDGDISGTLTWAAGDTDTKYIKAQIMADLEEESNESFRVQLGNPVGAVLGDTSSTRVTITDSACNVLSTGFHYIYEDTTFDKHCYSAGHFSSRTEAGHITINPGVTFFTEGRFYVTGSTTVEAVGEPDKRIWFRGAANKRDSTDGVYISGAKGLKNKLEYVVIRDAGGNDEGPALTLIDSRISLNYNEISGNGGYGIEITRDVILESFSANTISDNALGAILTLADNVKDFDVLSDYSGNDRDAIDISDFSELNVDSTWHALNVPIAAKALDVNSDLTIEPGTTILMRGSTFEVSDDGSLRAVGTEARPIIFKGEQETANYWDALYIKSNNTNNHLEHVIISHAGRPDYDFYNPLSLDRDARLTVKDITITDSLSHGVFVPESNNFVVFDPAEFTFVNIALEPYIYIN